MKKLFGILLLVCFGLFPAGAQSNSWEPKEMEKVHVVSMNYVSQFGRAELRAYLNFSDLMEDISEQLQEIIFFPKEQEEADPHAMEQTIALFSRLAQAYEQLHETYSQAARVASADLVFMQFSSYDVDLGSGVEVYEKLPNNMKDKKVIELYRRVFKHVCAGYDSFL